MQSHFHHSPFPYMESLSQLSWNVMERLPTSPSPMPWSIDVTRWAVNGANVEIPSNCSCMHQNLTWLDKAQAFTVWEGFKAQGCLMCPYNLWDRLCLHQCSSCSLIVIIFPFPSMESLSKLSWNVMEHLPTFPSPMSWSTDVARWAVNGANVEIPSNCARMRQNLTWLD